MRQPAEPLYTAGNGSEPDIRKQNGLLAARRYDRKNLALQMQQVLLISLKNNAQEKSHDGVWHPARGYQDGAVVPRTESLAGYL